MKMKKDTIYILIIILSIGCGGKSTLESDFEKSLPKEDLMILNDLVGKFDDLVESKYQGDVRKLLAEIGDEETVFENIDSSSNCKLIKGFENSTLEFRSEKLQYDTVYSSNYHSWFGEEKSYSDEPIIVTVAQDRDTSWGDIIIVQGEQTTQNMIEQIRKDGYWNHISDSSFLKALKEVNLNNSAIAQYIDAKLAAGELNHVLIAKTTLENDIDIDNYFIKRIIIFEVFRNQMKREHGC